MFHSNFSWLHAEFMKSVYCEKFFKIGSVDVYLYYERESERNPRSCFIVSSLKHVTSLTFG